MHKKLPKILILQNKYDACMLNYNIPNLGIIYRNYKSKEQDKDLYKIAKICKKKRYKLFVSNNFKLAVKIKSDGVYIPSFNHIGMKHLINKKSNFLVLGSAHNQKEISEKIRQKCNGILLSPIFKNKKSKKHLGILKFNQLSMINKSNFYALGGIKIKNLRLLKLVKIKGFAGISIFKKKFFFNNMLN